MRALDANGKRLAVGDWVRVGPFFEGCPFSMARVEDIHRYPPLKGHPLVRFYNGVGHYMMPGDLVRANRGDA